MADPSPLCALAYASFVSVMSHHGDPGAYGQNYEFAMFISTQASDIADRLRPCEGRDAELALITSLARRAVAEPHAMARPGPPPP